jgi:hypothetical protein
VHHQHPRRLWPLPWSRPRPPHVLNRPGRWCWTSRPSQASVLSRSGRSRLPCRSRLPDRWNPPGRRRSPAPCRWRRRKWPRRRWPVRKRRPRKWLLRKVPCRRWSCDRPKGCVQPRMPIRKCRRPCGPARRRRRKPHPRQPCGRHHKPRPMPRSRRWPARGSRRSPPQGRRKWHVVPRPRRSRNVQHGRPVPSPRRGPTPSPRPAWLRPLRHRLRCPLSGRPCNVRPSPPPRSRRARRCLPSMWPGLTWTPPCRRGGFARRRRVRCGLAGWRASR